MTTGRKNHLSFLAYTAMGLCIGIYVTFACTMSTAWNVLLIAGLLSIFTVLMTKDWLLLSIFCMSFSLPFGFSKAIVRLKESVYLPALYIQLVDFFIIGALVIWAWRLFTREEKFPTWSKTHTLAFLVVFWFAASIFWAKIPTMGFFEWLTLFKCFIFYLFISVYFRNPEVTSVFIIALLISALMQIAMTSAQQIFKDPLFFQGMKGHAKLFGLAGSAIFRPSGLCEHPNGLSSYLLYTQPIIFSLAYFYLSGIKRIFFFSGVFTFCCYSYLDIHTNRMVFHGMRSCGIHFSAYPNKTTHHCQLRCNDFMHCHYSMYFGGIPRENNRPIIWI